MYNSYNSLNWTAGLAASMTLIQLGIGACMIIAGSVWQMNWSSLDKNSKSRGDQAFWGAFPVIFLRCLLICMTIAVVACLLAHSFVYSGNLSSTEKFANVFASTIVFLLVFPTIFGWFFLMRIREFIAAKKDKGRLILPISIGLIIFAILWYGLYNLDYLFVMYP